MKFPFARSHVALVLILLSASHPAQGINLRACFLKLIPQFAARPDLQTKGRIELAIQIATNRETLNIFDSPTLLESLEKLDPLLAGSQNTGDQLTALKARLSNALSNRQLDYESLIHLHLDVLSFLSDGTIEYRQYTPQAFFPEDVSKGLVLLPVVQEALFSKEEMLDLAFAGLFPIQIRSSGAKVHGSQRDALWIAQHDITHWRHIFWNASGSMTKDHHLTEPYASLDPRNLVSVDKVRSFLTKRSAEWKNLRDKKLQKLDSVLRTAVVDVLFEIFHESNKLFRLLPSHASPYPMGALTVNSFSELKAGLHDSDRAAVLNRQLIRDAEIEGNTPDPAKEKAWAEAILWLRQNL